MTRARLGLAASVIASVAIVVAAPACNALDSMPTLDGGSDRASAPGDHAEYDAPQPTGVVLVHSAQFPSFRLCFENMPDAVPLPDSKVMPEANVVGVEIGSLVRLPPMAAPGTIFVIDESTVRATPGASDAVPCKELVADALGLQRTSRSLRKDLDFHVATTITEPLGDRRVDVLAITGCGGGPFLGDFLEAGCGEDWDKSSGNLKAKVIPLATDTQTERGGLRVQLFHLAPAIEAFRGPSGQLRVTFGALDRSSDAGAPDGGAAPIDDAGTPGEDEQGKAMTVSAGELFEGGAPTTVDLDDPEDERLYGLNGFRIAVTRATDSEPFAVEQSLADIQELSAPSALVTDYYQAASTYALLLLGDPSHTPSSAGQSSYNPRRAVHLLAVPVVDPEEQDAGASDASAPEDGTDGNEDGGR